MNFEMSKEWLKKKLAHCDDTLIGVGGTSLEDFKRDVEQRTVTPSTLANVPSDLGKVVRFVREQKGWTTTELATLADVDESEIELLESQEDYAPGPRTVTQLADACHFSRKKFIELAGHRLERSGESTFRFAANSKNLSTISDDTYEAIRALVEVLSQDANNR